MRDAKRDNESKEEWDIDIDSQTEKATSKRWMQRNNEIKEREGGWERERDRKKGFLISEQKGSESKI
jgi:hypothetical protein